MMKTKKNRYLLAGLSLLLSALAAGGVWLRKQHLSRRAFYR